MAAEKPYEKWTIRKLEEERAKIDSAIEQARERDKEAALESMRSAARKHGFELDELVNGSGGGKARGKTARAKSKAKVAPKYRNPDDHSQTWSGRGRKPHWIATHVDAGGSAEDFAIA